MGDPKFELVRSWPYKARHDFSAAAKLAEGPDAYLDVAIYHTQQAAEKAIKAFLVYADRPFGRTHDLEALVTLAAEAESALDPWIEVADSLTPYATLYRYPNDQEVGAHATRRGRRPCARRRRTLPFNHSPL